MKEKNLAELTVSNTSCKSCGNQKNTNKLKARI